MGAVVRSEQLCTKLRNALGLLLSPTYSKICFLLCVLVVVVLMEAYYFIKLAVQAGGALGVAPPSLEKTRQACNSPSSLNHLPAARCVTGPPEQVVACLKCPSPLPSPRLVIREPPSYGRRPSNTTTTDRSAAVLWDYNDLLISAQGASKCPYTSLVVAVRTEAHRRAQRSAIRRTWGNHGNYANCSFGLVFFMAAATTNRVLRPVMAEFQLHKDIVVELKGRWKLSETCTFVLAIEWVPRFVPNAKLTLVVTDDTFVDVKAILSALDWFSLPTGDLFGRATLGLDAHRFPQLEDCAVFAKPSALRRLQPTFADEALSCDAEVSLVTGPLSRKALLNVVHVDNMEPCNHGNERNVPRPPVIAGGVPLPRPFTRTQVPIREMERLYLQDLLYYHNFSSLV